jgi:hypothetical protein
MRIGINEIVCVLFFSIIIGMAKGIDLTNCQIATGDQCQSICHEAYSSDESADIICNNLCTDTATAFSEYKPDGTTDLCILGNIDLDAGFVIDKSGFNLVGHGPASINFTDNSMPTRITQADLIILASSKVQNIVLQRTTKKRSDIVPSNVDISITGVDIYDAVCKLRQIRNNVFSDSLKKKKIVTLKTKARSVGEPIKEEKEEKELTKTEQLQRIREEFLRLNSLENKKRFQHNNKQSRDINNKQSRDVGGDLYIFDVEISGVIFNTTSEVNIEIVSNGISRLNARNINIHDNTFNALSSCNAVTDRIDPLNVQNQPLALFVDQDTTAYDLKFNRNNVGNSLVALNGTLYGCTGTFNYWCPTPYTGTDKDFRLVVLNGTVQTGYESFNDRSYFLRGIDGDDNENSFEKKRMFNSGKDEKSFVSISEIRKRRRDIHREIEMELTLNKFPIDPYLTVKNSICVDKNMTYESQKNLLFLANEQNLCVPQDGRSADTFVSVFAMFGPFQTSSPEELLKSQALPDSNHPYNSWNIKGKGGASTLKEAIELIGSSHSIKNKRSSNSEQENSRTSLYVTSRNFYDKCNTNDQENIEQSNSPLIVDFPLEITTLRYNQIPKVLLPALLENTLVQTNELIGNDTYIWSHLSSATQYLPTPFGNATSPYGQGFFPPTLHISSNVSGVCLVSLDNSLAFDTITIKFEKSIVSNSSASLVSYVGSSKLFNDNLKATSKEHCESYCFNSQFNDESPDHMDIYLSCVKGCENTITDINSVYHGSRRKRFEKTKSRFSIYNREGFASKNGGVDRNLINFDTIMDRTTIWRGSNESVSLDFHLVSFYGIDDSIPSMVIQKSIFDDRNGIGSISCFDSWNISPQSRSGSVLRSSLLIRNNLFLSHGSSLFVQASDNIVFKSNVINTDFQTLSCDNTTDPVVTNNSLSCDPRESKSAITFSGSGNYVSYEDVYGFFDELPYEQHARLPESFTEAFKEKRDISVGSMINITCNLFVFNQGNGEQVSVSNDSYTVFGKVRLTHSDNSSEIPDFIKEHFYLVLKNVFVIGNTIDDNMKNNLFDRKIILIGGKEDGDRDDIYSSKFHATTSKFVKRNEFKSSNQTVFIDGDDTMAGYDEIVFQQAVDVNSFITSASPVGTAGKEKADNIFLIYSRFDSSSSNVGFPYIVLESNTKEDNYVDPHLEYVVSGISVPQFTGGQGSLWSFGVAYAPQCKECSISFGPANGVVEQNILYYFGSQNLELNENFTGPSAYVVDNTTLGGLDTSDTNPFAIQGYSGFNVTFALTNRTSGEYDFLYQSNIFRKKLSLEDGSHLSAVLSDAVYFDEGQNKKRSYSSERLLTLEEQYFGNEILFFNEGYRFNPWRPYRLFPSFSTISIPSLGFVYPFIVSYPFAPQDETTTVSDIYNGSVPHSLVKEFVLPELTTAVEKRIVNTCGTVWCVLCDDFDKSILDNESEIRDCKGVFGSLSELFSSTNSAYHVQHHSHMVGPLVRSGDTIRISGDCKECGLFIHQQRITLTKFPSSDQLYTIEPFNFTSFNEADNNKKRNVLTQQEILKSRTSLKIQTPSSFNRRGGDKRHGHCPLTIAFISQGEDSDDIGGLNIIEYGIISGLVSGASGYSKKRYISANSIDSATSSVGIACVSLEKHSNPFGCTFRNMSFNGHLGTAVLLFSSTLNDMYSVIDSNITSSFNGILSVSSNGLLTRNYIQMLEDIYQDNPFNDLPETNSTVDVLRNNFTYIVNGIQFTVLDDDVYQVVTGDYNKKKYKPLKLINDEHVCDQHDIIKVNVSDNYISPFRKGLSLNSISKAQITNNEFVFFVSDNQGSPSSSKHPLTIAMSVWSDNSTLNGNSISRVSLTSQFQNVAVYLNGIGMTVENQYYGENVIAYINSQITKGYLPDHCNARTISSNHIEINITIASNAFIYAFSGNANPVDPPLVTPLCKQQIVSLCGSQCLGNNSICAHCITNEPYYQCFSYATNPPKCNINGLCEMCIIEQATSCRPRAQIGIDTVTFISPTLPTCDLTPIISPLQFSSKGCTQNPQLNTFFLDVRIPSQCNNTWNATSYNQMILVPISNRTYINPRGLLSNCSFGTYLDEDGIQPICCTTDLPSKAPSIPSLGDCSGVNCASTSYANSCSNTDYLDECCIYCYPSQACIALSGTQSGCDALTQDEIVNISQDPCLAAQYCGSGCFDGNSIPTPNYQCSASLNPPVTPPPSPSSVESCSICFSCMSNKSNYTSCGFSCLQCMTANTVSCLDVTGTPFQEQACFDDTHFTACTLWDTCVIFLGFNYCHSNFFVNFDNCQMAAPSNTLLTPTTYTNCESFETCVALLNTSICERDDIVDHCVCDGIFSNECRPFSLKVCTHINFNDTSCQSYYPGEYCNFVSGLPLNHSFVCQQVDQNGIVSTGCCDNTPCNGFDTIPQCKSICCQHCLSGSECGNRFIDEETNKISTKIPNKQITQLKNETQPTKTDSKSSSTIPIKIYDACSVWESCVVKNDFSECWIEKLKYHDECKQKQPHNSYLIEHKESFIDENDQVKHLLTETSLPGVDKNSKEQMIFLDKPIEQKPIEQKPIETIHKKHPSNTNSEEDDIIKELENGNKKEINNKDKEIDKKKEAIDNEKKELNVQHKIKDEQQHQNNIGSPNNKKKNSPFDDSERVEHSHDGDDDDGTPTWVIVLIALIAILAIFLIILLIFCLVRRHEHEEEKEEHRQQHPYEKLNDNNNNDTRDTLLKRRNAQIRRHLSENQNQK